MARTKGSKNKPKVEITGGGNPDFNISNVTPSDALGVAPGAITAEDMEFDRELERLGQSTELPPEIEPDPIGSVVKEERPQLELLRDALEVYAPASNDQELREQIHTAKVHGCDSIEATLQLAKRFCKDASLESVGYFVMHDIKVYIDGHFERATTRDRVTVEQRNFGGKA